MCGVIADLLMGGHTALMSESFEPDPAVMARTELVEKAIGRKLPPHDWMRLQFIVEQYLLNRGLLAMHRWRTGAEELGVGVEKLRKAFADTDK